MKDDAFFRYHKRLLKKFKTAVVKCEKKLKKDLRSLARQRKGA